MECVVLDKCVYLYVHACSPSDQVVPPRQGSRRMHILLVLCKYCDATVNGLYRSVKYELGYC